MTRAIFSVLILAFLSCGTAFELEQVDSTHTVNAGDTANTSDNPQTGADNIKATTEELKLYQLIMEYREQNSLASIPLSKSLTYVAQQHCLDLYLNKPDLGDGCNAHSWSDKGAWSACCYTPDHKQAECIWEKPAEMTSYTGYGYEIACGSSDPQYSSFVMTAEYALQSWKKSGPQQRYSQQRKLGRSRVECNWDWNLQRLCLCLVWARI
ncbi:MAG: hypothetical protein IPG07_17055 [Crocinitomicaceae bacterium]|nr:hypothetical protein [Crocinitomicaceae bacterium]